MKRLYWAMTVYTALGLAGGLFYREVTRSEQFTGDTQLAVVHTHFLVLGTVMFAILLLLERAFRLSDYKSFRAFFWVYNAGVTITAVMQGVIGYRQIMGEESSKALAGISGMGHILLTVAFALVLFALGKAVDRDTQARGGELDEPVREPVSSR